MKTKDDFYTQILDNAILVQEGKKRPPELTVRDWNYFIRDTTPEPPHIIGNGVLPQKTMAVLAGEPKIGKSHLAISLAYHIASGKNWFQFPITEPHKTMIIQAENSYFNQRDRIKHINKITEPPYLMPKLPEKQLFVSDPINGLNINETDGYEQIGRLLDTHQPKVVIIDPLASFHTAEENSNSDMAKIMGIFHELKISCDISIILIHHIRKPTINEETAGTSIRGASSIRGACDTGMLLTKRYNKQTSQGYHKLEFELRNGPTPDPLTLELDPTCLTFQQIKKAQTCENFIVEKLNYVKEDGILQKNLVQKGRDEGYSKAMMIRTIQSLDNQNIIIRSAEKSNKSVWLREFTNESIFVDKL